MVRQLATRLRNDGVDTRLDQWNLRGGHNRFHFMEQAIATSDFVLIICTPGYAAKANAREGGVGYESSIITPELAGKVSQTKFVPVLREGDWNAAMPSWLKSRMGFDLRDSHYEAGYQDLLLHLHDAHTSPPPIGRRPQFNAVVPSSQPFVAAEPKEGSARFRLPNQPLGINWDSGFGRLRPDFEVFLTAGPAIWIRVMPTEQPTGNSPAHELKRIFIQRPILHPLYFSQSSSVVRSEDGFGSYSPTDTPAKTESVAFCFDTGEIWAVDTAYLASDPGSIPFLELQISERVEGYMSFLDALGVQLPFRWMCGIGGVNGWRLEVPLPPRSVRLGLGPQFLGDHLMVDGLLQSSTDRADVHRQLKPFFERVFEKCGQARPAYLDDMICARFR